ncbi:hypothetical protein ARSEF4850_001108 [Beauveria asiatica]
MAANGSGNSSSRSSKQTPAPAPAATARVPGPDLLAQTSNGHGPPRHRAPRPWAHGLGTTARSGTASRVHALKPPRGVPRAVADAPLRARLLPVLLRCALAVLTFVIGGGGWTPSSSTRSVMTTFWSILVVLEIKGQCAAAAAARVPDTAQHVVGGTGGGGGGAGPEPEARQVLVYASLSSLSAARVALLCPRRRPLRPRHDPRQRIRDE